MLRRRRAEYRTGGSQISGLVCPHMGRALTSKNAHASENFDSIDHLANDRPIPGRRRRFSQVNGGINLDQWRISETNRWNAMPLKIATVATRTANRSEHLAKTLRKAGFQFDVLPRNPYL